MLRRVETATGIVNVELDAAAGRILIVQCPEHGRMSESLADQSWKCTVLVPDAKGHPVSHVCGRILTRAEAEKMRQDGFDEIRAADREDERQDRRRLEQTLADRRGARRVEKFNKDKA
jgi:hypothetical protein